MAELSGAELKVLLYVARRTYGFGKESDNISLNQMAGGIKRRDGSCLDQGTGLSRSGVKAACNGLIQLGILVRVNNRSEENHECEESTYRLNLYAPSAGVGQKKAQVGQKEPQVGQKGSVGRPELDRGVGQELAPQETDQETEQETAAGEGSRETLPDDAAAADALVEELVSHGVGRTAAARFAREKPDTCRRQLAYLPYAKFKTTKGGWLANAIRDEYGPPPGYDLDRARSDREREMEAGRRAKKAIQKQEAALREETRARVGEAYQTLHEAGGEVLFAFNEHVEKERAKMTRIAVHLSPERRDELLASFDSLARRLELFEAWTNSGRANPPPEASALKDQDPSPPGERKGGLFMAQAS